MISEECKLWNRKKKNLRLGPAGCWRSEFRFKFRLRKVGRAETIHTFIVITSTWQWKKKKAWNVFITTEQIQHNKWIQEKTIKSLSPPPPPSPLMLSLHHNVLSTQHILNSDFNIFETVYEIKNINLLYTWLHIKLSLLKKQLSSWGRFYYVRDQQLPACKPHASLKCMYGSLFVAAKMNEFAHVCWYIPETCVTLWTTLEFNSWITLKIKSVA